MADNSLKSVQECRKHATRFENTLQDFASPEFGMLLARRGLYEDGAGNPDEDVSEEQGKRISLQIKIKVASLNDDVMQLQTWLSVAERGLNQAKADADQLQNLLQRLREAEEALVGRNVEVECLEKDLAQASEQICALSDQVFLQVEAGEMHRQLEIASARTQELEAWLASREADLLQTEGRCAQLAELNDRLSLKVQEMEMIGKNEASKSARTPPRSARHEEQERTIRRLHADVERLRKAILGKDEELRRTQQRVDACKQALVDSKRSSDARERAIMGELAECKRNSRKYQELYKTAKGDLDTVRRRQGESMFADPILEHKRNQGVEHAAANRPDGDGVYRGLDSGGGGRADDLERRIRVLEEQRRAEQEAVMMHMKSTDEETQRVKNDLASERMHRSKAERNARALQMEIDLLQQQLSVRKLITEPSSPSHIPEPPPSPASIISNLWNGLLSPSPRSNYSSDSPSASPLGMRSPRASHSASPASPTKRVHQNQSSLETIAETHKETDTSPRDGEVIVMGGGVPGGGEDGLLQQAASEQHRGLQEGRAYVLGAFMQFGTPNSPDWRVTM